MTVTPLHGRGRRGIKPTAEATHAVPVAGTFTAPSGAIGRFHGTYRLERLIRDLGQIAGVGVFAGELVDVDDAVVGIGSRRRTTAAVLAVGQSSLVAAMGPVEVDLIGFPVLIVPFEVAVTRIFPASADGHVGTT